MKAGDFLGPYQMMEQYRVASAEEVKVENLADRSNARLPAPIALRFADGGIYACLVLALVMIYQATHHVNFAQGAMAMVQPTWLGR
jgi:hypothetical protein